MIITQEVSNKIKFLCSKISEVEWSGVLFYSVKGSIRQFDKVEFTIEDIYLMNKGTKTYTEYDLDDDLIDYRMSNPKSLSWKIGMVHSHNSMKSYFSHTDMSELNDNSEFHNYYLSLIVNNFGEMVAKIAFRGETSGYACKDEQGKNWNLNLKTSRKVMFTFDCDIVEEGKVPFVEKSFAERVTEIVEKAEKKEKEKATIQKFPPVGTHKETFPNGFQNKNFAPVKKEKMWFQTQENFSDDFDMPPSSKKTIESRRKLSHEERVSLFTAYVLRIGDDSPEATDSITLLLEELEALDINIFDYTSRIMSTYPAMFEKFWDEFGDIDGDFFRLVTEDVVEILEESFDEYELVEHLLSGFNIMLNRLEIL